MPQKYILPHLPNTISPPDEHAQCEDNVSIGARCVTMTTFPSIGKNLSYSSKKSLKNAVYDSVGSFLDRVDCQSYFSISQQKDSRDLFVIILVVQSSILGGLVQFCNSCSVIVKIGKWSDISFNKMPFKCSILLKLFVKMLSINVASLLFMNDTS